MPDLPFRVTQAEFVKAITHPRDAPPPRPSVVFAGRSNVGKSTLLNKLVGRKNLARTSNTPGRTREIHYYSINDSHYFIDVPGYGYAKVSAQQRQWGPMMRRFFESAEDLRLIVVLLDARRDPTSEDLHLLRMIEQNNTPYLIALTKCDKISRHQTKSKREQLRMEFQLDDDSGIVPVSGQTGEGVSDLLGVIAAALNE